MNIQFIKKNLYDISYKKTKDGNAIQHHGTYKYINGYGNIHIFEKINSTTNSKQFVDITKETTPNGIVKYNWYDNLPLYNTTYTNIQIAPHSDYTSDNNIDPAEYYVSDYESDSSGYASNFGSYVNFGSRRRKVHFGSRGGRYYIKNKRKIYF